MISMTGYAGVNRKTKSGTVQIILRSLNFKYLDVSVRNLLAEDILLEEAIRRRVKSMVNRGKIEVTIIFQQPAAKRVRVDESVVEQYVFRAKALAKRYNLKDDISVSDILRLPQALTWEQGRISYHDAALKGLQAALDKLIAFKVKEGLVIQKEVLGNLKKLKANLEKIKKLKPTAGASENGRADIDEEVSLMAFYIKKMESVVRTGRRQAKGKSMDFLSQEILRELNAASSKTKEKEAALMIVEAKNYIERIREQAQNVE